MDCLSLGKYELMLDSLDEYLSRPKPKMEYMSMERYKTINDAILRNEENLKHINERWKQLDKIIISTLDVEKMPTRELYGHIHALKHHVKSLHSHIKYGSELSRNIINGWKILNEKAENDPNLAEDWQAFLVTMKLTEVNEVLDG